MSCAHYPLDRCSDKNIAQDASSVRAHGNEVNIVIIRGLDDFLERVARLNEAEGHVFRLARKLCRHGVKERRRLLNFLIYDFGGLIIIHYMQKLKLSLERPAQQRCPLYCKLRASREICGCQ
jgi:hypothetical protein